MCVYLYGDREGDYGFLFGLLGKHGNMAGGRGEKVN